MLRNLLTLIAVLGFTNYSIAQSQSGTIKGTITENDTDETVPMANIVLELNGVVVAGAVADFDGDYTIKPVNPGSYTVKISFIGFASKEISDVLISANKITYINAKLKNSSSVIGEVELIEYVVPLIDPDKSGTTKTKEEITALPTRNVASVAAQTAGIYQEDEGGDLNVRGSRSDATFYYIDGVKVRASNKLPQASIEQMTVITGGLPASYGDATGGIISITTRGPSNEFFGGVEVVSSRFLDDFGYNLVGFNLSGPLMKNDEGNSTLGFFLSGEYESADDFNPSGATIYKVKDDVLSELEDNPLIFSVQNGIVQAQRAAEFVSMDDLEQISARQNVARTNASMSGKIDFKPSLNTNMTVGGNFSNSKYNESIYTYSMFNPSNNPQYIDQSWRVYGRFQQSFGATDQEQSASTLKNAFFTLQADYSKDTKIRQDEDHKDNLFNYGYIGKFTPVRDTVFSTPVEWFDTDEDGVPNYTIDILGLDQNGSPSLGDTMFDVPTSSDGASSNFLLAQDPISYYNFQAGGLNPNVESYTQAYYDFVGAQSVSTIDQITGIGAAVNGDRTDNVYSIWYNSGRQYNGYSKYDESQLRFTGSASADINDHAVQFGFEYEQRDDRYYGISPVGLWTLAEQKVNNYIGQFEGAYEYLYTDAENGALIGVQNSYNFDEMSAFAINFRESLGLSNEDFVDIHTYNPDQLDVSMFSSDDLFNGGSNYASWYGFDAQGNSIEGVQPGMNEFLTDTDENGNYKREIGAFQPIYVAGYIQDKFAFDDIIFNIGVRVDRYDANQEVLKDRYSIYDVLTAGEVTDFGTHPSNIGDDYVVYVDDNTNAGSITGYRNGDDWFNADGLPITDPNVLNVSKGVLPMLADPDALLNGDALNKGLTADAFEDYEPQVTVMPRISFNFPISDEAMFYAYYDVLAQRPSRNRMDPTDYLFLAYKTATTLNNPDLKPQKTTNYEVGFKQTLSASSALTINAFYREMRDMIQYTRVAYAFPKEYYTWGNIDFGTVKGLSMAFELRRTKNISFNANYTMQFADGSGSSDVTGVNIVGSEQPNLRATLPLDFDQRHNLTASLDFRYGSGKRYNGPIVNGKEILSNMGVNFLATAGSGTPYSRQLNATQVAQFGINNRSYLEGSVNGSRLPWSYRMDMRVNKSFDIKWGDVEESRNKGTVNIYLQVQNILNTANIVNVYQYTGNADDDGYLTTAVGIDDVASQTNPNAFADMYTVKLNDPNNFTRPRTVRLGLTLDF
jgi:outer membrane receptor protein involved in Fe transport